MQLYNEKAYLSGYNIELGINTIARQSLASVLYKVDKSVFLATICVDAKRSDLSFTPLNVQYIEKAYAVGKIPSGFIKREAKPSTFEVLTSRLIDRSLRPLFAKDFYYPVQINILALSLGQNTDVAYHALSAAAMALYVANLNALPLASATRIRELGNIRGFDLFVSGVDDRALMIEMQAVDKECRVDDTIMLELLDIAKDEIDKSCEVLHGILDPLRNAPLELPCVNETSECMATLEHIGSFYRERIDAALSFMAKSERHDALDKINDELTSDMIGLLHDSDEALVRKQVALTLQNFAKKAMRSRILKTTIRPDGRALDEIRKIEIATNLLPSVHGSALFRRGGTEALVTCTLGSEQDMQSSDVPSRESTKEGFMLHYNFPPFCVGEASMIGSPSRRELGHGNLAYKALKSSIEDTRTIRLVSEILSSNGSSSMATICGGYLALKAADISLDEVIAGVAMGLILDENNHAILTDITGLEDHYGDMDFKVAGSREYITAMQMDIKLGGLDASLLRDALKCAKSARARICDIMEAAIEDIELNTAILPAYKEIDINPSRIGEIIGRGGQVIRDIIEKSNVSIDIDRDAGMVKICGANTEGVNLASTMIKDILKARAEVGEVFCGKVARIMDFGAFISHPSGVDGLLHAKKITPSREAKVRDYIKEGEEIKVRITSINNGKIELDKA